MTSRRVLKSAEAIREVVSTAILMELKDPRIRDVTVTFVEVSPDLRHAKVHVSVMGDEVKQRLSLRGLTNAAGFLQTKIAQRIDTRYTPRLQFVLDQGVKHSIEVSRILSQLFPKSPPAMHEDSGELDSGELEPGELEPADSGPADSGPAEMDPGDSGSEDARAKNADSPRSPAENREVDDT